MSDLKSFKFKKQFGQNFIFDKNYLLSVLNSLSIEPSANVLEIGAGMGTLSECLAQKYHRVVSYEIDKTLTEHLREVESRYDNLSFVFGDILDVDMSFIEETFHNEPYYMIANLPYYITSQIVFRFLLQTKSLRSMTVLVQKEVAERFCAKSQTRDYGVPSVILDAFGSCRILKNVPRTMFTPQPNVDSAFIEIDIDKNKYSIKDADKFQSFIHSCFMMKRKTLMNNLLKLSFTREKVLEVFDQLSISPTARPEEIDTPTFVKLFDAFYS